MGIKKLLLLVIFLSVFSCVTGVKVTEVSQSLEEVRAAINIVAIENKWVSANRRVFESRYFGKNPRKSFDPDKAPERLFARFSILGDRRPYQILVEVIREKKDGLDFVADGEEPEIAEKLAQELVDALTKSREDRNAIDSFRAF